MKKLAPMAATILFILSVVLPIQASYALQRSVTTVTGLIVSRPYFLGDLNGELYFSHQSHLWKTDGTIPGTVLLTNAMPLVDYQSLEGYFLRIYAEAVTSNGLLFFSADDGNHGQELWRSDGTPQGTFMVKDIDPAGSSMPIDLMDVNGELYFRTGYRTLTGGIWKSNGTDAGTTQLISFPAETIQPFYFMAVGLNGLYVFTMDDDVHGVELWKSDGTPSGTVLLYDINSTGSSSPAFLAEELGKLYFTANEGINDTELWVTDGTSAGTLPLTTSASFGEHSHMECLRNGICYLFTNVALGINIWRTNGTPGGTVEIATIADTGGRDFVAVNGVIYVTTDHGLWKTDGTSQGTEVVKNDFFYPGNLTYVNGELFFIADDQNNHGQLWKSDGTTDGTLVVMDFGDDYSAGAFVNLNGMLFPTVWGPVVGEGENTWIRVWQVYKSDGTQTSTVKVADLTREELNCSTPICTFNLYYPEQSTIVNGKWYFQALDGVTLESKLWTTSDVYFSDVLPDYWAFSWVERLANAGLTSGCGSERYCPEVSVTRAQMAVLLEKGLHGSSFVPPDVSPSFGDTAGHWAEDWIEALKSDGITSGCGAGIYCPEATTTRAEMAVFLLRAEHGSAYIPPSASGLFTDVPSFYWAAPWIEQLAAEGITSGCGAGIYCPDSPVTRAEMAVFLVRTFNLP